MFAASTEKYSEEKEGTKAEMDGTGNSRYNGASPKGEYKAAKKKTNRQGDSDVNKQRKSGGTITERQLNN